MEAAGISHKIRGAGAWIQSGTSPEIIGTHAIRLYIMSQNTQPVFKSCGINDNTATYGGGGAFIAVPK